MSWQGSGEAVSSDLGHLTVEQYVALGKKRAPNFTDELRQKTIYPIFKR